MATNADRIELLKCGPPHIMHNLPLLNIYNGALPQAWPHYQCFPAKRVSFFGEAPLLFRSSIRFICGRNRRNVYLAGNLDLTDLIAGLIDHHDSPLLVVGAEIDGNLPRHLLGCGTRDVLIRTLESDGVFKTKAVFNIEVKYRHPFHLPKGQCREGFFRSRHIRRVGSS